MELCEQSEPSLKAALYYGPGDIRIEDVAAPEVGAGEVLVRVHSCGLCGTDLSKYKHRLVPDATVLGHEIAGEIVEAGPGVANFKRGNRVIAPHHIPCFTCDYCRHLNWSMCRSWKRSQFTPGGFAELVRIGAPSVQYGMQKIPDHLDFDAATLVEPLGCCLRAFKRSPVGAGDTVVVIGAGTAGLLHVQLARLHGATRIISLDLRPHRLERAKSLGADVIVNAGEHDAVEAVREATESRGADLVITAVASVEVVEQAVEMTRDGGTVNVFAECPPDSRIPLDPNLMYRREVTLTGTYSSSPHEFRVALSLVASGRVNVVDLITHRMPLGQLEDAIEMALRGKECLKIIIRPNE